MSNRNILSLLGLALRGGNLVVGEEPVEAVARARDARVLLVAGDAAENTVRRVRHFAEAGACLWVKLPFTKDELGGAVGRSSVAIVAVTDIGLANAVVHKLAEKDPKRYGEAAKRLEIKAQRAAERRAEQQAHEKNIRTGKVSKKKKAAAAEEEKKAAALRKEEEQQPRAEDSRPQRAYNRKPGDQEDRKPYGFRPSAQNDRRSYGDRDDRKPFGERKSGDRKPYGDREDRKPYGSRPSKDNRPKPRAKSDRYAHSRPVKKGKGSFKKKQG